MVFLEIRLATKKLKDGARGAFTLVELLAVIAVVGILLSILLPVVRNAMDRGLRSSSLSNLRQLAAAHQLYVQDNQGLLVPIAAFDAKGDYVTWRAFLAPYLGVSPGQENTAFHSPADPKAEGVGFSADGRAPSSYGINSYWRTLPVGERLHDYLDQKRSLPMSAVRNPSGMIFMCDIGLVRNPGSPVGEWEQRPGNGNLGYARFPSDPHFNGGDAWNIFPRHGKTEANVVFYDGHADSVDIVADILPHAPGEAACIYDNN